MRYLIVTLFVITLLPLGVKSQPKSKYSYLMKCYNNEHWDSVQVKIDGIGSVFLHFISSDTTDAALSYYVIPDKILNKGRSEIVRLTANYQPDSRKNNSKTVFKRQYNKKYSTILVKRSFITDSDPYDQKYYYDQKIVICEGNLIYEIGYIGDKASFAFFDHILKSVINKNCP
jgi:hypothetical protein